MKKTVLLVVVWGMLTAICFAQDPLPTAPSPRISTQEEIGAEFESVPCKDKDRLAAVKALFEKMGATPAEISVEKAGSAENVVVKIAGASSEEKIVIGAHFDKTADGCGAIDNWSGVVSIAHMYRTMKSLKPNRTLIFVGFAKEETGMVGSRTIVDNIKKEEVASYCAMINIDSLGMAIPQAADNLSSKSLVEATATIAKEVGMEFAHANIQGGSDSGPFLGKKIPAITLHGVTSDWQRILHTSNDIAKNVKPQSVYLGYRLALMLLAKVDGLPCDAFRETKEDKNAKASKEKK